MTTAGTEAPARCAGCGAELGPALLACPACARIVHGAKAKELAADATAAEARGDLVAALGAWRAARELLPAGSSQHEWMTAKVQALSRTAEQPRPPSARSRWTGAWGVLAVLAWKLKAIWLFLVANAKFLILGLAKGGALLPALMSLAVFRSGFGWTIAGGLLASLYVHELGHVAWSRRLGIPVTPPMFVPGWGAYVRLHHRPVDVHEDARIGLAGPAWGLAAAVVALALGAALRSRAAFAVAWWGATINLLNLIPFASLDGGRAFGALSRRQRSWVATALAVGWLAGGGWPCALLAALTAVRAADRAAPTDGDRLVLAHFLIVAGLLAIVAVASGAGAPHPAP